MKKTIVKIEGRREYTSAEVTVERAEKFHVVLEISSMG